jgi:hypothetical protein
MDGLRNPQCKAKLISPYTLAPDMLVCHNNSQGDILTILFIPKQELGLFHPNQELGLFHRKHSEGDRYE